MLCAAGHVDACARMAARSAGVAFAGICGAQTDFFVVSAEPDELDASAENCDLSVRAYVRLEFTCGRYWLRAWRNWPVARVTPARAIWIVSLSRAASVMASSSESARVCWACARGVRLTRSDLRSLRCRVLE